MENVKSEIVLPGDIVLDRLPEKGKIRLGPGLYVDNGTVKVTHMGVLKQTHNRKLYVPSAGDSVIGVIKDRNSEFFLVDINGPWMAELPVTSFENVTKRNIPSLKSGDLIFGTVLTALPFSNPILTCVNSQGKATGMGVLTGGSMTRISCALARSLLSQPTHPALEMIGENIQFEIIIGLNGMMWVNSGHPQNTIYISKTLVESESLGSMEAIKKKVENALTQMTP